MSWPNLPAQGTDPWFTPLSNAWNALRTYIDTALAGKAATAHTHAEVGEEVFSKSGTLAAAVGTARIYNRSAVSRTITGVFISCGTAPVGSTGSPISGASVVVDVNNGASSIFGAGTGRPRIASGVNADTTDRPPTAATWAPGAYLAVDIDFVGTTTPGADLTVTVSWSE